MTGMTVQLKTTSLVLVIVFFLPFSHFPPDRLFHFRPPFSCSCMTAFFLSNSIFLARQPSSCPTAFLLLKALSRLTAFLLLASLFLPGSLFPALQPFSCPAAFLLPGSLSPACQPFPCPTAFLLPDRLSPARQAFSCLTAFLGLKAVILPDSLLLADSLFPSCHHICLTEFLYLYEHLLT
jgi:hypothetical protein